MVKAPKRKRKFGGVVISDCWVHPDIKYIGTLVQCRKHPYYRAIRIPRTNCDICQFLYEKRTKVKVSK